MNACFPEHSPKAPKKGYAMARKPVLPESHRPHSCWQAVSCPCVSEAPSAAARHNLGGLHVEHVDRRGGSADRRRAGSRCGSGGGKGKPA